MTRPPDPRRSGDPRVRAAEAPSADRRLRQRAVIVALAVGVVVGIVVVLALVPSGDDEPDEEGRSHAEAACELTVKAEQAARVDTGARAAAALFLLDRAIVESERAAEAADGFTALDDAVQEVHAAAHAGGRSALLEAYDAALTACGAVGADPDLGSVR